MSFGFGVGDFLAVAEISKKIWDRFEKSPSYLKDARQDLENIASFIQYEELIRISSILDAAERARVQKLFEICKQHVQESRTALADYKEMESKDKGSRTRLEQFVQRLAYDEQDMARARSRIRDALSRLESGLRTLDSTLLRQIESGVERTEASVKRTEASVEHARTGVEQLHKRENTREKNIERQKILDWICPSEVDYTDQQNALKLRRRRGIGEWFLNSPKFKSWLHGDRTTLLCSGMPGVGKTMITSFVVGNLLERYNNDNQVGIAYIYCQFSRHKEQTPEYLMSSILRQLLEQQNIIPNKIRSLYMSNAGKHSLDPDEVSDLLYTVLSSFKKSILVIDALDELHTSARNGLMSHILTIQQKSNVNVYVTSRYTKDVAQEIPNPIQVNIRAREEDLRCNLAIILERGSLLRKRPDLQKQALSKILRVADGIFLLAVLYAEHLAEFDLIGDLVDALESLEPVSDPYGDLYTSAMQRLQAGKTRNTNLGLTTICWLFFAKRPLRLKELLHALAITGNNPQVGKNIPAIDHILNACAGLIVVDETNDTVGLFHKTFDDFLSKNHMSFFPQGDETIGRTCITYLSSDAFANGPCPKTAPSWSRCEAEDPTFLYKQRLAQFPLYTYASRHWHDHIRGSASETCEVLLGFLVHTNKLNASCQSLKDLSPRTTGAHIAVRYSLDNSLKRYLKGSRSQLNVKDNWGRTSLSYAAELNSPSAIRYLIDAGGDPNLGDDDDWKRYIPAYTPLAYAALQDHAQAVQILLQKGANVNRRDAHGRSALSYAAEGGSEASTQLLLKHGATPDDLDKNRKTPISYAAEAGSQKVTSMLLERGAKAKQSDSGGRTPLLLAAKAQSEETVLLLLAKGAEVNSRSQGNDTPLSRAVEAGMIDSVRQLLRKGATVDVKTSPMDPLSQASKNGPKEIIRLLLSSGGDVQHMDNRRVPPLAYAARNGWTDIVQLILDKGAAADTIDTNSRSVLSYAVESGSIACVELLLNNGAQINRPNPKIPFCEQLYYALGMVAHNAGNHRPANETMLNLLLSKGANPNKIIDSRRLSLDGSPLLYALKRLPPGEKSTRRMIELLVKHRAEVDQRDGKGRSVLTCAEHHTADVQNLLRQYGAV
ncbi:hypothetical protein KCU65_g1180, partial [Aureobasidium melanogenum]